MSDFNTLKCLLMATVCLLVVALLGKFCQFETILTSSLAGDDDLNNEDDGLGVGYSTVRDCLSPSPLFNGCGFLDKANGSLL